jgi:hypothetical protein
MSVLDEYALQYDRNSPVWEKQFNDDELQDLKDIENEGKYESNKSDDLDNERD